MAAKDYDGAEWSVGDDETNEEGAVNDGIEDPDDYDGPDDSQVVEPHDGYPDDYVGPDDAQPYDSYGTDAVADNDVVDGAELDPEPHDDDTEEQIAARTLARSAQSIAKAEELANARVIVAAADKAEADAEAWEATVEHARKVVEAGDAAIEKVAEEAKERAAAEQKAAEDAAETAAANDRAVEAGYKSYAFPATRTPDGRLTPGAEPYVHDNAEVAPV